MSDYCNHPSFTRVQKDGYQYCEECGKAFAPPKIECNHRWENIGSIKRQRSNSQTGIMLECSRCGDIKFVTLF